MPIDAPPEERRRPRWGRRLAAVGVLLLLLSPWWARPILKRMAYFRVRHVEVRNARFTPAGEVRSRLGIDTTFSIWNDLDSLRLRVESHPEVREASISRRFPATLVVRLEEYLPVALVPGREGMKAYDGSGRLLPIDPSRTPVDVPLASRPDSATFRFLEELREGARDIYDRLNEVQWVSRNELRLDLVKYVVRIPPDIGVDRLALISSVEAELAARHAQIRELDFRFRDQVIARLP